MSRPEDESGLDGLGILEDDLLLDADISAEPVTSIEPDPVKATSNRAPEVVMPTHEADPTGWKRAWFIGACVVIALSGIGFLIYGVTTWNQ